MTLLVVKRDGRSQVFDSRRIERALALACADLHQWTARTPQALAAEAAEDIWMVYGKPEGMIGEVTVEQIQDTVEEILRAHGEWTHATHYRTYRQTHRHLREQRPITPETRAAFDQAATYFATPLQLFQYYSKYSRFDYGHGRRETWPETVDRALTFLLDLGWKQQNAVREMVDFAALRESMLKMEVLPSMRLLAMAGPAAARNNLCLYNCSYLPVADINAFSEALLISMCGCGVGYSVERQYVEQFPRVARQRGAFFARDFPIEDTTEGWMEALRLGLESWMLGQDITFDYRAIRAAGVPLRVKGGQASGPGPLKQMLDAARRIVLARQGQFLRPIDAHDIMCWVGHAAVSGGVRRTAMIALFDWDDAEMRTCKDGDLTTNLQRYNANNSVVWPEGVTQADIMRQLVEMHTGNRGEPGIFNRPGIAQQIPARRQALGAYTYGTNPCGEIILRPFELCNLSVCVARPGDSYPDLARKVRLATQVGTLQALATHFPGLRPEWQRNAVEERLLGVDITGQMDAPQLTTMLRSLQPVAVETNRVLAGDLGINQSAAVTCVKPSGNSSVLLDTSSGMHPRYAPYYLRRVRVGTSEPLTQVLRDAGLPLLPEVGQHAASATTWVAEFPVKAPPGARVRRQMSALDQLAVWLNNKVHWTEHNPSCTIQYTPDELLDIAAWLWKYRALVGGLTFLPRDDAAYLLAPYEEIDEAEYTRRAAALPRIDFSKLGYYETTDQTEAARELACVAGACELV